MGRDGGRRGKLRARVSWEWSRRRELKSEEFEEKREESRGGRKGYLRALA
jgi:hypothetical protein